MKVLAILLVFLSCFAKAQEPQLKGGLDAFVNKNRIYPPYAKYNCIQGIIKIAFKIDAKGNVYAAEIAEGMGIDLDEETLRLINMSSGKWIVPKTHDTSTVLIVPVNFKLDGYGCEKKSSADIKSAIQAYKDRENLIDVIANYYQNKGKGEFKAEDEQRILRIKEDLSIDDDYLDLRIEAGLKKYKQGDLQGACKEFNFVKNMGSDKANEQISKYCN